MKNTLVFILCLLLGLPICGLAADAPKNNPQPTVESITIEGRTMGLKVPAQPAPGKPWLWVGEFAGHLGSLEDGLVAKGWHVAWVDVSNQFGSPRAMVIWEKVYAELHGKRGLSARPALLGISRGGLYVNAWTRLHPDRVSVLYLDNGVCDIRSWPGGFQLTEKGSGSGGDWDLYKTEFKFASDDEAKEKSVRPAAGFAPAVKNGVFLISVHGTADTTVPYVDNAKLVVDFWEQSGGRFKTFPKEGGNHHPHGLPDPVPLIDLLCKEAGTKPASMSSHESQLNLENDSTLSWRASVGRAVSIKAPQLTLIIPGDNTRLPFKVKLRKHSVQKGEALLEYELSLNQGGYNIAGSGTLKVARSAKSQEDVLIVHTACTFSEAVTANVETVCCFDVQGEPVRQMGLPERNGYFKMWPILADVGGAGRFDLGNAAKGPVQCSTLGMPVVGLSFGDNDPQLAIAADPYCGSVFQAEATTSGTRVTVRTTYMGAVVPVRSERRTLALEFHRNGTDGTLRNFYRTIPEIEPGAPWTQGIHLVYYDYLSEKGEGWFKDLKALADRIPARNRGHVAVCLHGWYDYFQQYAYDHKDRKLFKEWTAFPGTFKVPMSLAEMHRRLKFAKDLGFRVLLYFADGTNSDGGSPNFRKDYMLKDKTGKTFPGWKGPDSIGQPWMMDPSVPELRDWYRGYLKALLNEYAKDVDGFVWDETFYIETNFISYAQPEPAYADRAMMSLVSELTQMVQSYHGRNPGLVFLASDLGRTSYALVANGTYQDSAMREEDWGPSMFANYRNCLWSCNWYPLQHAKQNEIAAEKYGLPQGVSNGWEDNCGPSRMPSGLLDDVLRRFTKNVESNRDRLRYLTP